MTIRLLALAALLALALAACGEEAATAPGAEPEATEPEVTEPEAAGPDEDEAAVEVALHSTDFGDVLVDGDGMTLYLFDADQGGESTCYGDCAGNWPPLVGQAQAGDGVDQDLLGVTERTTGELQVTYAGHPLYYFAGDSRPGETSGQGVGDVWWVVDASGAAVHGPDSGDTGGRYDY